eukprot:63004_1
MANSGNDDSEISPNDSKGWGEVFCNSGELTRGVVEPVVDHCQQEKPEIRRLGSLGGGGDDNASVEPEEPRTIQAYQLVLPLSGIGPPLANNLEVGIPEATLLHDLRQGSRVVYWVSVSAGFANWCIPRSMGEFETLHTALHLVEGIDSLCVPQFPGMYFLESSGSVKDPSVVEQCRKSLQVYLQAVCIQGDMWKSKDLVEFLDVRTSMLSIQLSALCGGGCWGTKQHHTTSPLAWEGTQTTRSPSGLAEKSCHIDSSQSMDELDILTAESQMPYPMVPHSPCLLEYSTNETEASCHPDSPISSHSQSGSRSRPLLSLIRATTPLRIPLSVVAPPPEIDLSDLDSIPKRISNFHFSSQMATGEYGGLCDTSPPPIALYSVDRPLMGVLSPSPSCTHGAADEYDGNVIPGVKWGTFLKCLRKGSSILGDPYDPLFYSGGSQSSFTAAANTADNQQQHCHTMSDDHMFFHEGLNRSTSCATSVCSHSAGSIASHTMSVSGDAQCLTLEFDVGPEDGKGTWNVSHMLEVGVHGTGAGLQLDLVPTNVKPCNIDRRVAELLRVISPTPIALEFRESVVHFISEVVSHALGTWCFAVGGFALNSYLPDEDISVCTYICRGQEPTWCFKVNELLCKESSNRACDRENEYENSREDKGNVSSPLKIGCSEVGGRTDSSCSSKKTDHHIHQLSYVNFINSYPFQRISCAVDNKVAIKITANCLDDFVMYVLYEDVNKLLGKDHLFKQSILLIKAWWLYESRTYTGFKMMNHVNEATLFALIFAVVNVHHERLHTPLQVLAMFFHIYGTLSWKDVVVGPAGPVPRHAYRAYTASTYPSSMLVPYDMITHYMNFLKGGIRRSGCGMQKDQQQQFATGSSGGDMINEQSGNSHTGATQVEQELKWEGIMVVVHPLVPNMNIIGEWGKTPKANKVVRIMNMSASSLQRLFLKLQCETSQAQHTHKHPPSTQLESTSIGMFDAFFGLTWARFGQGWRPDVWHRFEKPSNGDLLTDKTSTWTIPSEVLYADLDELHRRIDYCLLLLQEEVTEGGIQSLVYHILQEKGAIPVGEVGKLLQDITSLPHLSRILKEKYGGLKRFLENHSDIFDMSKDHPFNPCVYIRDRVIESDVENAAAAVCSSRRGGGIENGGKLCSSGNNKNMKWRHQKK